MHSITIKAFRRFPAAGVLLLFLLTTAAQADTNVEQSDSGWSFKIAPYAWLAGTGGTVVTNGEETDFDLSFEDIFELTTGG